MGDPVSAFENSDIVTAAGADTVSTSETTASLTYADLATPGPAVTLTTGATVIVIFSAIAQKAAVNFTALVSVDVSGATTLAANDTNSSAFSSSNSAASTSYSGMCTRSVYLTGLTPGSNTFTLKYRCDGGTWTFLNRTILVLSL